MTAQRADVRAGNRVWTPVGEGVGVGVRTASMDRLSLKGKRHTETRCRGRSLCYFVLNDRENVAADKGPPRVAPLLKPSSVTE